MSNRLDALLSFWSAHKTDMQWVLATLIEIEGSSYRKPGAMMLINDLGKYYGLLSGGCLESDIMRQARQCWENGQQRIIEYDMREEEDIAWQMGIGCGGRVRILLQPVSQANDFLYLDELNRNIQSNTLCWYKQNVSVDVPNNDITPANPVDTLFDFGTTQFHYTGDVFQQLIIPSPHFAILGGGVDALPLASIAHTLGWRVSVVDPRISYARKGHFPTGVMLVSQDYQSLSKEGFGRDVDAFMVMHHNVDLDAQGLDLIAQFNPRYIGLLGPGHRTVRVKDAAKCDLSDINLANPAGLRLGGDLPETIALSIVSEIQAVLSQADAKSISGYV